MRSRRGRALCLPHSLSRLWLPRFSLVACSSPSTSAGAVSPSTACRGATTNRLRRTPSKAHPTIKSSRNGQRKPPPKRGSGSRGCYGSPPRLEGAVIRRGGNEQAADLFQPSLHLVSGCEDDRRTATRSQPIWRESLGACDWTERRVHNVRRRPVPCFGG
jgi:hypothetical protein